MKIILSFLLVLNCSMLFAQQKGGGVTITRDTINISGYVYNYDATPCVGVRITSHQLDTIYNLYRISAVTDKNGYFKLNGAKFNDTLSVTYLNGNVVYNKGSRYLVLYTPMHVQQLNIPVEVTAQRKRIKPQIKFTTRSLKIEPNNGNAIFSDSEFEPNYPGGMYRYRDDLIKKIAYPQKAIENNIEGTIEVGFTVLRDGSIDNYKILKGLGYGCDDQVIQAMKSLKRWKPGIVDGRPLEVDYVMAIQFKLTDK